MVVQVTQYAPAIENGFSSLDWICFFQLFSTQETGTFSLFKTNADSFPSYQTSEAKIY